MPARSLRSPLSAARLAANRRNARRSTGPRTARGKAASSRNARRHGLRSPVLLQPGDDRRAFRALLAAFQREYPGRPVFSIAAAEWRMRRASACFEAALDAGDISRAALAMRYHATFERAFYLALGALQAQPVASFGKFFFPDPPPRARHPPEPVISLLARPNSPRHAPSGVRGNRPAPVCGPCHPT